MPERSCRSQVLFRLFLCNETRLPLYMIDGEGCSGPLHTPNGQRPDHLRSPPFGELRGNFVSPRGAGICTSVPADRLLARTAFRFVHEGGLGGHLDLAGNLLDSPFVEVPSFTKVGKWTILRYPGGMLNSDPLPSNRSRTRRYQHPAKATGSFFRSKLHQPARPRSWCAMVPLFFLVQRSRSQLTRSFLDGSRRATRRRQRI